MVLTLEFVRFASFRRLKSIQIDKLVEKYNLNIDNICSVFKVISFHWPQLIRPWRTCHPCTKIHLDMRTQTCSAARNTVLRSFRFSQSRDLFLKNKIHYKISPCPSWIKIILFGKLFTSGNRIKTTYLSWNRRNIFVMFYNFYTQLFPAKKVNKK